LEPLSLALTFVALEIVNVPWQWPATVVVCPSLHAMGTYCKMSWSTGLAHTTYMLHAVDGRSLVAVMQRCIDVQAMQAAE
jgi:hypothetical protein